MVYENIVYEGIEYTVNGFINSNGDLEYSILKSVDGGCLTLEDRKYSQEELQDVLEAELENFASRQEFTATIIGHPIRIVSEEGDLISVNDLDDEVYKISESILDGNDGGDIYIVSKQKNAKWDIV